MKKYIRTILEPLKIISYPKAIFMIGLFVEGLAFPCIQLLLSKMQKLIVNSVEFHDYHYMQRAYIIAAIILMLVIVFNPLGSYYKGKSARTFMNNLRFFYLKKMMNYKTEFYETHHSGDILSRLRNDAESLYWIYSSTVLRFLLAIFYGVGSIIIMFSYSWQLAIIVILLGAAETAVIAKVSTRIEKGTTIIQELTSKQTQLFLDIINSLNFFKMMSLSHIIKKKYSDMNNHIIKQNNNVNKINIILELINSVFEALNLIIVLGIGIALYLHNYVDLGSVMSFLILQDGISYMIDNMKEFFKSINWQMVSFKRTFEFLNIEDEEEIYSETKEKITMGDIKFEHISFQYDDNTKNVLDDVNFVIPKGKITVIQGPSGSGKSTILKLLLGFYQPKQGSIKISDLDYKNLDLRTIRENITYVAQSAYFFHDTVESNIRCANETISFDEVVKVAKYLSLDDVLKKKEQGYQTIVDDIGNNFSGGERQRIALARAMLKNSDIVILDEATSALDVENEALVYRYIDRLANMGKTVIIVAHRQIALQFAHKTIYVDQGRIL